MAVTTEKVRDRVAALMRSTPRDAEASIEDICRRHRVIELSLFGSVVRDDFDFELSGIDLLVEFDPEAVIGFLEIGRLEAEFSSLFNRNVELVSKGGLRRILHEEILSSAIVIYSLEDRLDLHDALESIAEAEQLGTVAFEDLKRALRL